MISEKHGGRKAVVEVGRTELHCNRNYLRWAERCDGSSAANTDKVPREGKIFQRVKSRGQSQELRRTVDQGNHFQGETS